MPSAEQLEGMRARYAARLPRTCTIKQPGTPSASRGQFTQAETNAATGVKCSFRAARGDERVTGGATVQVGSYVLRFERGAALKPEMRVVFDATEDEPEKSFSLVAPLDAARQIGQQWLATSP